jgi:serine/threonine-protein kinase
MNESDAKVIPGSETSNGVLNPVFSPDGSSIAFFSNDDNTLKRISTNGGAAVTLCPATGPYGMDWSEDGILFGQSPGGILRVSPNGGKPETLVAVKETETASLPQLLPGGKAVLFSLVAGSASDRWDRGQVVVQSIPSGDRKVLIESGSDGRYLPTGHIVYAYSGTLRAVPFDLRRLEVRGGPVPVIEGISRAGGATGVGLAQFSFSGNGSIVYRPGPVSTSASNLDLGWVDRTGAVDALKLQPGSYSHVRIAPNGKQVAFMADDGKESVIWVYDLSGATSMSRLTFGGKNRFPVWSPDSKSIVFQSDREGDLALFQQRADGSGTAERVTKPDADSEHIPNSWSPDGKTLLFTIRKASVGSLWMLSLRDKKSAPYGNVQNPDPIDAVFSPDGRWVAYTSWEASQRYIFVQPFPATGARHQVPTIADHGPLWSRDGKELLYIIGPGRMGSVPVTFQPGVAFGNAVEVFRGANNAPIYARSYDIAADGQRIIRQITAGNVQTSESPQLQVVLHWFEEVKRRVPSP